MFNRFTHFLKVTILKKFLLLLLIIIAISGISGSYYFYEKYRAIQANPNLEAQKETDALVFAVGKLIELPQGEAPTIATIADKEKLKNQPFFKSAQNGDKLFAYNRARIAILYRPGINKIIIVAPISINQPQNLVSDAPQGTPANAFLRIAYYNGTTTVGLAVNAEKIIKGQFTNSQTVALSNASKTDYKETIVVDLAGKYSQEVVKVAKLLNGKVAPMPEGEVSPDADILIISGKS